jgi:flagellar hook protein FlgE
LISAINSALSGLAVNSGLVSTAGGNLANLNTTGYKNSRLEVGTNGAASQGALARGNVDPAQEMVNLMVGEQGFKANIKVLQTAEEMLGSILDIRA